MLPLVHTFDGGQRFEALFAHWADKRHTVRLQGGWDAHGMGRYTILGFDPYRVLFSYGDEIHRIDDTGEYCTRQDPFQSLEIEYQRLKDVSLHRQYKLPFYGGAMGYLGYELRHWVEKGLMHKPVDVPMPDMYFAFFDVVCVYDNLDDKGYILSSGLPAHGENAVRRARQRLDSVLQLLETAVDSPFKPTTTSGLTSLPFDFLSEQVSTFDKASYVAAVEKAKDYIRKGDIYQVNLSQRFSVTAPCESSTLFHWLRHMNPSPFGAYIKGPDWTVISVSPERFFGYDGKYVETRPIKGTRPRGSNSEEDEKLRQDLMLSEKDRAEHAMIVDLARSDLGQFCEFHSVDVSEFMISEAHPTIWHLVSTIRGIPRPGISLMEAVRAAFPGSSISGAPKARAMAIIDELEPVPRGIYTGSIGYLGIGGAIDLNVAIRTVCHVNETAYFHVGGAVVADSDPVQEYEETLAKGLGIARAVVGATQGTQRVQGESDGD